MSKSGWKAQQVHSDTIPCNLCCFYPWSDIKMELSLTSRWLGNTFICWTPTTTWVSHPVTVHFSNLGSGSSGLHGSKSENYLHYQWDLRGLGLWNPISIAKEWHTASQQICAPLVDWVVHQEPHLGENHIVQQNTKAKLCPHKCTQQKEGTVKNLQTNYHYSPTLNEALSVKRMASSSCH